MADVGAWDTDVKYNRYVSLAANAGEPMIAYYDETESVMMFSKFHDVP